MSQKFLTAIDLSKNELQNGVVQNLASAPASPVEGQIYHDTTTHATYHYNGSAWRPADAAKLTDGTIQNTALATNPLARANHTGTQISSTISDLATTVQGYRLDQFAVPTADLSINSHKLTNVADPTSSTDAANKRYVDTVIQGLTQKPTAIVATAAALPANTYANGTSGVGATLTATANAALTIDSYSVAVNDVILVKNEATGANNGLYTVTQAGDGTHPFILTRHVDMDTAAEFPGAFIPVGDASSGGATNKNTVWLMSATASITVGTTAISFTQIAAPTSYIAGNGLNLSSTTFNVVPGNGVLADGSSTRVDPAVVARKYTSTFGDGSTTSFDVVHGLGNQWATVQVYQAATPFQQVFPDIKLKDANTVTLIFNAAPTTNQYRVNITA